MTKQEYTLEEISYSRKEDRRILEAVLKSWFKDPKSLNFVSPSVPFPFKFKKWLAVSYQIDLDSITTLVLKKDNWIVGHISMRLKEKKGHLFHLFIDKAHRKKGLAQNLVKTLEDHGKEKDANTFSLFVVPKNEAAKKLYEKMGYQETDRSNNGSIKLEKLV
ncbi:MAG: GNAT family N-acetyltransferase [Candidatus Marinimicrobia bacterium]|jgi:ribosomal protein S18 acetylase RimI-like enzyme|nr:GNAT family N-acetyltransferase [Candidatus Neomarinimicrobiota bacterium]MBT3944915.1 GNAT family N-acetyltransferase [Candidatus Neomarinimicrobiota bacterium]MBT4154994.1 GNAT family N-acetyltransferase [Candidatus Neomarinimicrobiota bacterium]MBT4555447.1 GNAT family N-acetyltransferase [Candidatus Neomarinimicrobiota bacterium]MBT4753657.1 GNAT family N-acetyltransferase [Candidatus Neomarinimicrobiota bacterium]|tara:strand:- start:6597 stop:7082 length:486 start_codon:yes stop_codon:yes gene_type:complete